MDSAIFRSLIDKYEEDKKNNIVALRETTKEYLSGKGDPCTVIPRHEMKKKGVTIRRTT